MRMNRVLASLAVATAIAAPTAAYAASSHTPSPSGSVTSSPAASRSAATDRDDHRAELAAKLAEKLGVSEAKVTAALDEIRSEQRTGHLATLKSRLDARVADGTLTQAQADARYAAAKAGEPGLGGRHHGEGRNGVGRHGGGMHGGGGTPTSGPVDGQGNARSAA